MKRFSNKTWKSNAKQDSSKLQHKEISEDVLAQITGGRGMIGCHPL